jgi:hypothetical protein
MSDQDAFKNLTVDQTDVQQPGWKASKRIRSQMRNHLQQAIQRNTSNALHLSEAAVKPDLVTDCSVTLPNEATLHQDNTNNEKQALINTRLQHSDHVEMTPAGQNLSQNPPNIVVIEFVMGAPHQYSQPLPLPTRFIRK